MEIQTDPFVKSKSTAHVTYVSKEYKRHMHAPPKRQMHVQPCSKVIGIFPAMSKSGT